MPRHHPERVMALGRAGAAVPDRTPPGRVRYVLYRDGHRDRDLDGARAARDALDSAPGAMLWISMDMPDHDQIGEVARAFGLHRLAAEDAVVAHQRPKVEDYPGALFLVLRPARYDTVTRSVRVGEVHVFCGENFAVTISHTVHVDLDEVRATLEAEPAVLAHGTVSVLYTVLDRAVDDYAPVVSDLQDDVDEVETRVFDRDPDASRRIYRIAREVTMLQRAVDPLTGVCADLLARAESGGVRSGHPGAGQPGEALHTYLRDVADHVTGVRERVDGFQQLLRHIMDVNDSLISQEQNEAMKTISSWGGILVVPTLIASVYGMNIPPRPGFEWTFAWPVPLTVMALASVTLYLVFRRNGWL
ncbi:magnesium and cobalt transport protein CorA [Nocardiopsis sp. EMB25]|uniref:magnesium and cobalt transport protein CorA n=1 Tax=Nocardiopsis TaxID=2013 RepID=UPI00034CC155|nr:MULTISPECIES: magnesium and cobalt transport protein CorA [Nocardiopsis]MCY9784043.1 magnesium and cobalt transport protein CorA [Nocardiopsis sp. EMB25]